MIGYLLIRSIIILSVLTLFSSYWYVTYSVISLFSFKNKTKLITLISLFFFSMAIISNIFLRVADNFFTRTLYAFSYTFIGLYFISFFVLLLFQLIFYFIKVKQQQKRYTVIASLLIVFLISFIQGQSIISTVIEINSLVDEEVRIAHLSDIHLGAIYDHFHMTRIVALTNDLDPDFIVITGDLFDGSATPSDEAIGVLNSFNAPAYLVLGNHEYYKDQEGMDDALAQTDLIVLRNPSLA